MKVIKWLQNCHLWFELSLNVIQLKCAHQLPHPIQTGGAARLELLRIEVVQSIDAIGAHAAEC